MTLCELATAKHHAPMECRGFSGQYEDGSDSPADCVNALSRSAQFWSSYSGYLREVREFVSLPNLCRNKTDQTISSSIMLHVPKRE
ncbi:hypothetical protein GYMLUDRAFT_44041 [Collybiopsis luxurians FD-317 M1]|uniref:Uncharacterized protein n=1 Tax=Collybiopsis luxurians FD-317 M1 TaxID=944289 RepID=A0A0D0CMZ4_9AGAR|nr:hypothetical protein GYMLUDRAFT_44041 [Collybiopsis luxurians FD-317 M1]